MVSRSIVSLVFFSLLILSTLAQKSPVEVVQQQLDSYNAQDIDAFSVVFAEDAQVFINLGDSAATMVGREEIKARYGAMFKNNPDNKSTLIGRMVQGNFVFDHEWITGRNDPFKLMAIYEVQDGLITRCWFAR